MYTLTERNGWLFVKQTDTDYFQPKQYTWYWPTGIRFAGWSGWFATPELARDALDKPINPLSNCSYQDERGLRYQLVNGGQTKPEFTEVEDIPEPKQRGRKCELVWQGGNWHKHTKQGRVLA